MSRRLGRPWRERAQRQFNELQAQLEQVRQAHAGDPGAQRRATAELVKEQRLRPAGAWAPLVLVAVATRLPALCSPLNQTLAERIAGIVVLQD